MKLELSKRDLQLIAQSLEHCLNTCHSAQHGKVPGCEDCDAATELNKRVKAALGAQEAKG